MISLKVPSYLRLSNIGAAVSVTLTNQSVITGTVRRIDSERITICEAESGLEREILCSQIESIVPGDKAAQISNTEINRFLQQHEVLVRESHTTLADVCRSELLRYAGQCRNERIREYLNNECAHLGTRCSRYEAESLFSLYTAQSEEELPDSITDHCIRCMMLMRMNRFQDAVAEILEMTDEPVQFMLACFFTQINNHIGALYWLNRYYSAFPDSITKSGNTWWYYLSLSVRFSAYEETVPLMEQLAKENPALALDSLLYLLLLNQSRQIALNVYQTVASGNTETMAEDLIAACRVFLVSDEDNNYHRYCRCMENILSEGEVIQYDDDEQISGYIYEYIPEHNFGFILGHDLLSYFVNFSSENTEQAVIEMIRTNINAFVPVSDEELCAVRFNRSQGGKRSYSACNVVM